jgi:diguanylate cyclase (GGDEF)-like protein
MQLSIAVEHAKLINRIVFLSKYDNMTGIYNRHYFEELYEINYNRALRYKEVFCLARFDIKDFAIINSTYGNSVGDKAIKLIARIIKKDLRKTDLIGRIGEDEVGMLLINTSIEDAINKINIVKSEIEKTPIKTHTSNIFIKISAGYSYFPDSSKDMWGLFAMADYERKRGEK